MIIRKSQFASAYTRIRQSSLAGTCAVLILVALDVDALCACKMLSSLLKADFVPFQIRPIAGWSDLEHVNKTLVQGNEELRFVVMLNFGAHFDPQQYLEVDESVKIYVIDAHKPVLLENCYMESNVLVWDDDSIDQQKDVEQAFRDWHEEEDRRRTEEEEAGDSDGEEEDGDDRDSLLSGEHVLDDADSPATDVEEDNAALTNRNGKRRSRSGSIDQDDSDRESASDSDTSSSSRKRRRTLGSPETRRDLPPRQVALNRRKAHDRNGATLSDYYDRGNWYGDSVSSLIYGLASDLGREDNDLLWLSIVGLTSLTIHNKVDADNYLKFYKHFKDEVIRLNPPSPTSSGDRKHVPPYLTISPKSEHRFMLFQHWNLEDAMLHSPYVGAKMKLYCEPGRNQLRKLFAQMGYSLVQCRQSSTHMDLDLKQKLREKLDLFRSYGLDELMLESFERFYGYKVKLSASDTSYVLAALLEAGAKGITLRTKHANEEGATQLDEEELASAIRDEWLQNFNDALDALDNVDLLYKAIPVTMALQQAVVRTGTALIDKREIRSLRSFRLSVVKEGPDVAIFTHPLALQKLAIWISEAVNESERQKGRTKHLPFVIAALDDRTDRYLVLGTSVTNTFASPADSDDRDKISRNKFGNAFQELSHSHQARFRLDSFDASVVECNKADLGQLLETLSLQVLQ